MGEPQRSPLWPEVERKHRLIQPCCLVCGRDVEVNVHHKYPFDFVILLGRPDLELDERNLYTLCADKAEQHHVLVGHLDNYGSYNPDLEHFIALCRGLTGPQIRSTREFVDAVALRPVHISLMTEDAKAALRLELDKYLPLTPESGAV